MTSPALRDRFLGNTVSTASPGQLLVLLYERLVRDLTQAETALLAGEVETPSARLTHAQDIITELRSSLNVTAWTGGPALASIYDFLLTELITANVKKDAARVASCRDLVLPLLDAWRQALVAVDSENTGTRSVGMRIA